MLHSTLGLVQQRGLDFFAFMRGKASFSLLCSEHYLGFEMLVVLACEYLELQCTKMRQHAARL